MPESRDSQFFFLLTTSVHSLEPLDSWPNFSATAASLGAAGVAEVVGVGPGFFPEYMFDKFSVVPQNQQWGQ